MVSITSEQQTQLINMYVGLCGKAPSITTLHSLANGFIAAGSNFYAYAKIFASDLAFASQFTSKTTVESKAATIVANFGMTDTTTTTGVGYHVYEWTKAQINAGNLTLSEVSAVIGEFLRTQTHLKSDPVWADSAKLMQNKTTVAEYYAVTLNSSTDSADFIASVTSDPATVTTSINAPAVAAATTAAAVAAAAAAAVAAAAFKVTNDGSGNYTIDTSHGNVAVAVSGANYVFTPTTGSAVSVATAGVISLIVNTITLTGTAADLSGETITGTGTVVVTGMAADTAFGTVLANVTNSVDVAYVAADLTMSTGNFTGVETININTGATLTMTGGATGFGIFGLTNQVISGAGNMVLNTTTAADTFNLSGITQSSFTGTLTINTSDGIDTFTGTSGNDTINCGVGADVVNGGAGNDTILGGDGADNITGGAGADIMTGGIGADIFIFAAADFTATTGAGLVTGMDAIQDFTIGDADLIRFDTALTLSSHANGTGTAGLANITSGFATFNGADADLAAKLAAVVAAVGTDAVGKSVAFVDGANSYLFVVGNAATGIQSGDALIKLTGITATALTLTGTDISNFA